MRLHSLKLNWAHKGRRNCRRPGRVAVSDAQSAPATTTATTLLTLGQLSTWSRPRGPCPWEGGWEMKPMLREDAKGGQGPPPQGCAPLQRGVPCAEVQPESWKVVGR